ncbi:MAG: tRNA 2-selenouridine(34) synthase MnmH [Candidatus Sericytochromatia bacterium]
METIEIKDFFNLSKSLPTIDVRSQSEYKRGHLINSFNIPLFNDKERHEIGLIYKKVGKEQAMMKGLELVGPNLKYFVKKVQELAPEKKVLVYCWRGGMRSNSFAMLLNFCGFKVKVLQGGYKAYRNLVLEEFKRERELIILGGKTGSGKTKILNDLGANYQFIDLEKLANHKGSAFGGYQSTNDLTVEYFENKLHYELEKTNPNKILFLEDESRTIGKIPIPENLWKKMRTSKIIFLEVEKNIRIQNIIKEYADYKKDNLITSVKKIEKRLGGLDTKKIITYIEENNYNEAVNILLNYYDKAYLNSFSKRVNPNIVSIFFNSENYNKAKEIILDSL